MYVTEPRTTWKMSPGYSSDDNDYDDDTDENLLESGLLSLLVHRPPITKYSTHQFPNNFLDTIFAGIRKARNSVYSPKSHLVDGQKIPGLIHISRQKLMLQKRKFGNKILLHACSHAIPGMDPWFSS